MTKKERLLSFLQNGSAATPKQITSMFGIANPSATVSELRKEGFAIYANTTKLRNGTTVTKYKVGTNLTKGIVAAAAAAGYFAA
jgi:hypothetical protein